MRPPKDCSDMSELRAEIDVLDRQLVDLMATRLTYIDRAAEIKLRDGLPARIPSRVEEVVAKVRNQAKVSDLPPSLAESIWREMIEFSIDRENEILDGHGDPK